MYHVVSRVRSGGGAASLFSVAGRLARKDASLFDAFSGPWTFASTVYTLLYIERRRYAACPPGPDGPWPPVALVGTAPARVS